MLPERFPILVDGRTLQAEPGWSVAVALWNAGQRELGRSVSGQPRGPLCAMGICFECRVTIDGRIGIRACLEPCRPGIRIETRRAREAEVP